jgi:hypothetical protein
MLSDGVYFQIIPILKTLLEKKFLSIKHITSISKDMIKNLLSIKVMLLKQNLFGKDSLYINQ